MSDSLPASVVKATKGEYDIPIKRLWLETWRQLLQMPKTFWQGMNLVLLVLFGTTIFMGFGLRLYDIGILHFQNYQAQLPHLQTLHGLNSLKVLFGNFAIAVIEILRALLTVSLAFLALNHIRNQPINITMVFAFFKTWRNLLLISLLVYLLNRVVIHYGLFFLFSAIHLYPLLPQNITKPIFALGFSLPILLLILLNTYNLLIAFMASLLILDQKMTFKKSIGVAFKSINRHALKNIALLFLASWAYIDARSDLVNPLFSIQSGFGLYFYYLVLLPGLILTVAFVIYKIIVFKNKASHKNITLMLLRFMLGLFILVLFFLGCGLIWLLPVIALLIAIQYQYIFLDNHLAYV
jgi:hypothetical protein